MTPAEGPPSYILSFKKSRVGASADVHADGIEFNLPLSREALSDSADELLKAGGGEVHAARAELAERLMNFRVITLDPSYIFDHIDFILEKILASSLVDKLGQAIDWLWELHEMDEGVMESYFSSRLETFKGQGEDRTNSYWYALICAVVGAKSSRREEFITQALNRDDALIQEAAVRGLADLAEGGDVRSRQRLESIARSGPSDFARESARSFLDELE